MTASGPGNSPFRRADPPGLWCDNSIDFLPEIAAAPLEKIASVARKNVLTMAPRPGRPWLDSYPRIIHLRDGIGEDFPGCGILGQKRLPIGGEETSFEYLKKALLDNAHSRNGRHHLWAWSTSEPDHLLDFISWLQETHQTQIPQNVWVGTSVTTPSDLGRVASLLRAGSPDTRRFVILKPIFESVDLKPYLGKLDWCIAGQSFQQEAGYAFDSQAARHLHEDCRRVGTALFLTSIHVSAGPDRLCSRLSDQAVVNWDLWPADLQLRQIPDPTCLPPRRKEKTSMKTFRLIAKQPPLIVGLNR